jgi:hypothetical protein
MDDLSQKARRLAGALEPFAGQVYFSPECHEGYARLGFGASPGEFNGVAGPEPSAYFCSRGSVMGQVAGEVVAAAFGVFSPAVVVPLVDAGWQITDATTICAARDAGAIGQLTRILGDEPAGIGRVAELLGRAVDPLRPEGKALFAGQMSLDLPGSPMGDAWRQADRLREYRGDVHIAAWVSAGLDACEMCLLTEPYWGLPLRTYSRTRGWTGDEFDAAEERLIRRGLLSDGGLTDEGRALREAIEVTTDRCCEPAIDALGDDLDELLSLLLPWGAAIREAKGYPASGPHDLAGLS